jgi:hypothetical protein
MTTDTLPTETAEDEALGVNAIRTAQAQQSEQPDPEPPAEANPAHYAPTDEGGATD